VLEVLEREGYAAAVRLAYRTAYDSTVRSYGLTVPSFVTGRQFQKEFLRPDMGSLSELLPELYLLYEPVRFGKHEEGDRGSLRALLEKLYSQTSLAVAHNPLYQSSSGQPLQRAAPGDGRPPRSREGVS